MQLMGMDRPLPVSSTPSSPPQANGNSDTLRDFLKSTTVPVEAATMTR